MMLPRRVRRYAAWPLHRLSDLIYIVSEALYGLALRIGG